MVVIYWLINSFGNFSILLSATIWNNHRSSSNHLHGSTFGSQPSNCFALVISGCRCFGSSTGNGLYMIFTLLPVNCNTSSSKFFQCYFIRVANVHRHHIIAQQQPVDTINEIVHKTKTSCLRSIAEYSKVFYRAMPVRWMPAMPSPSLRRIRGPYVLNIVRSSFPHYEMCDTPSVIDSMYRFASSYTPRGPTGFTLPQYSSFCGCTSGSPYTSLGRSNEYCLLVLALARPRQLCVPIAPTFNVWIGMLQVIDRDLLAMQSVWYNRGCWGCGWTSLHHDDKIQTAAQLE